MFTLNNSPLPTKSAPQSKPGIKCPNCGHHHKPGNICSFNKSNILDSLFKAESKFDFGGSTSSDESKVAEAASKTGSGISGHSGGNPYHDEGGKFTTKDRAASQTTGKGEGAVSLDEKKPEVGSGRGSHNQGDVEDKFDFGGEDFSSTGLKQSELKQQAAAQNKQEEVASSDIKSDEDKEIAAAVAKQKANQDLKQTSSGQKNLKASPEQRLQQDKVGRKMAAIARDKPVLAGVMGQHKAEHPEKYQGSPYYQQRKERGTDPRPSPPGIAVEEPKDPYTDEHAKIGAKLQNDAYNEARVSGADHVTALQVGQQAWMNSANAFEQARKQGIPAEQVMQKLPQEGGATLLDRLGIGQAKTGTMAPGAQTKQPIAEGTQEAGKVTTELPKLGRPTTPMSAQQFGQDQPPSAAPEVKPPIAEGTQEAAAGTQEAAAGTQEAAPISPSIAQKVQQKAKYDQMYNKAKKLGFSHEDAHAAANEHAGTTFSDAGEPSQQPQQMRHPSQLSPQEFRQSQRKYDAEYKRQRQGGADHPAAHQTASEFSGVQFDDPGDLTKPADPSKPKRGGGGSPFSQWYSAGHSIGAGLSRPGGAFSPTAGFAAQRAHELLNPSLQPERGRPSAYFTYGGQQARR
jgi:hypothetical protein